MKKKKEKSIGFEVETPNSENDYDDADDGNNEVKTLLCKLSNCILF